MQKYEKYFNLMFGLLLVSFSFNLFLEPFHLAAGGVSGLSLIVHKMWNINESTFIFIVNIGLLLISYLFLGARKTKNTLLGSILFPIFVSLTGFVTKYIDLQEIEIVLIAILGGISSGIGYGFIFKSGYTSGGTDILNQIMEKYMHMPISKSIILVDGFITIVGGFVFGVSNMIYALIALVLISVFSDKQIVGIGDAKTMFIYSEHYQDIENYLHKDLKIDSTNFSISGGYNNKKNKMIMTVIHTKDYYRIKESILIIDPKAFMTVIDSYYLKNANIQIRSN